MEESFERRWKESAGPATAPELRGLAHTLYDAFAAEPVDLPALKMALVALLRFLVSPSGRHEANVVAVDAFVCLLTAERAELQRRLPAEFQEVLDGVSLDLHDGFQDPELARRVGASVEALLQRAELLAAGEN